DFVLLAMIGGDGLDRDRAADEPLEALDGVAPLRLQVIRDIRVRADQQRLGAGACPGDRLYLAEDFSHERRIGLHDPGPLARGAVWQGGQGEQNSECRLWRTRLRVISTSPSSEISRTFVRALSSASTRVKALNTWSR